MKDELLRDRIVVGIENSDVCETLLNYAYLNLDKAVQICYVSESAAEQLKTIVDGNKSQPIISTISKRFTQSHKFIFLKDKLNSNTKFSKTINDCRNCDSTIQIMNVLHLARDVRFVRNKIISQ